MWFALYLIVAGTTAASFRPVGEIWMPAPECWAAQEQVRKQKSFLAICSPTPVMPRDATPDIEPGFRLR